MLNLEGRTFARPVRTPTLNEADRLPPENHSFGEALHAGQATYPLVSRSGVELSVALNLEAIHSLGKSAPVAARVRETIRYASSGRPLEPSERARLDLIDVERMDCEAYQRGMALLHDAGATVGLISTSYRTLARTAGRYAYMTACLASPVNAQAAIFAEVTDVDSFTPRERLAEVCGLIRAHRQGVMIRLDRDPRTLETLMGDLSVAGAALDAGGPRGLTSASWPPFRAYLRAVKSVVPAVLLEGLEPIWAKAAQEAGATHAVFAPCEAVHV